MVKQMIEIGEYPLATERAISIVLEMGTHRKVGAIVRLRDFYRAPSERYSRMGLLEAKTIVESAIQMVKTWDKLMLQKNMEFI